MSVLSLILSHSVIAGNGVTDGGDNGRELTSSGAMHILFAALSVNLFNTLFLHPCLYLMV